MQTKIRLVRPYTVCQSILIISNCLCAPFLDFYGIIILPQLYFHKRRKVLNIWGQDSELGGGGGKLFASCKLIGAPAPNQCQIITFFTLKIDNITKL